ncbi:hypothetical protein SAMN05216564_1224 [Halopenitus persicus]|uniref:Uncharacterized protein n=1 Tax=Halopenitus persicus TaxID=1048396 RepID=A0A1H3PAM6_9EURY|nr:hypothetical protein SAMN05216564_1224 [Halopenitus persicus]
MKQHSWMIIVYTTGLIYLLKILTIVYLDGLLEREIQKFRSLVKRAISIATITEHYLPASTGSTTIMLGRKILRLGLDDLSPIFDLRNCLMTTSTMSS